MDYKELIHRLKASMFNDSRLAADAIGALQARCEVLEKERTSLSINKAALLAQVDVLKADVLQANEELIKSQSLFDGGLKVAELVSKRADRAQEELAKLREQRPIGHLNGTDMLAEFMSLELRADHEAHGSYTPKNYTVPVYADPRPAPAATVPDAPQPSQARELSDAEICNGWKRTFSTENPFCPCNLKSFTKSVNWAIAAINAKGGQYVQDA